MSDWQPTEAQIEAAIKTFQEQDAINDHRPALIPLMRRVLIAAHDAGVAEEIATFDPANEPIWPPSPLAQALADTFYTSRAEDGSITEWQQWESCADEARRVIEAEASR
jgi:hypothetical protein